MTAPAFLSRLCVEDLGDGRRVRLVEPLRFWSAERGGLLVVPAGLVTDFASVPRGWWNVFPPFGRWNRAAVVHDAAYQGALVTAGGQRVTLVRPLSDRLFLEGLEASGVGAVTRRLMYWAVRTFGADVYHGLDHLRREGGDPDGESSDAGGVGVDRG